jgi:hypothetical protein
MNAYGIDIWRSVKHNGEFVTNANRFVIIHARNEQEAKTKVTLAKAYINDLPALKMEVSAEIIYSVTKLGTVRIEPFYVYSGDKSSISVKEFKRRQQ